MSSWTYGPEDLNFVLSVIRPDGRAAIATSAQEQSRFANILPVLSSSDGKMSSQAPELAAFQAWPCKARRELLLPNSPGVYALFLREGKALLGILPSNGGLLYIGRGRNLRKRCHFSGKTEGHSPRRSLAAILWQVLQLEPELGANGNFRLSPESEKRLDAWMHDNLLMGYKTCEDFELVEEELVRRLSPSLNLTICGQTEQHKAIKAMRSAMQRHAEGLG